MADTREFADFLRRLRTLLIVLVAIVALGTIGLVVTEGVGLWRGFIWTLDILATVGSIPAPETVGGQIVKVALIVLGVGTLFYGLVTVTEVFVSGHLAELLQERRAQKLIDATSDHYIICGFGRVGRQVARDLRAAGARYVVVDHNPEMRDHAQGIGVRFIEGEPSDDEVLRSAGVMRARGVIACVDSDADNIFITLTVRGLRPDIAIVARASEETVEAKLLRAGATRVISPYKTSGAEMARLALNPQIRGALEVAPEYRMEEIEVAPGSAGEGQAIGDVRGGAIIVGVRDASGQFQPQPSAETVLHAGDVVTAMGTGRTMERLEDPVDRLRVPRIGEEEVEEPGAGALARRGRRPEARLQRVAQARGHVARRRPDDRREDERGVRRVVAVAGLLGALERRARPRRAAVGQPAGRRLDGGAQCGDRRHVRVLVPAGAKRSSRLSIVRPVPIAVTTSPACSTVSAGGWGWNWPEASRTPTMIAPPRTSAIG